MVTTALPDQAKHEQGVLGAGLVGAWVVVGLLGIGIAINIIVIAATTTANTLVQAPVRMVATEGAVSVWHGAGLSIETSTNTLTALNADPLSAALARADVWGLLLLGGIAVLVLVPAVRSAVARAPFAPGNARRITIAAGVTALGWVSAAVLPMAATQRLLTAVPADARADSFAPAFLPNYWLLGLVTLLLALALVVRHGERVAADAEGLV